MQMDAIEAHSRAQTQQLQREWEQRLEAAVAGLKAEEQAKMYMQEVRIEQLTQRLVAVEQASGDGNGMRPVANGSDATVSEERIATLITSVELLRGQISDLETQLSAVSARRNARNGAVPVDVDRRLRDVERGQQQSFANMEERLAAQSEAVVERCATPSLSRPLPFSFVVSACHGLSARSLSRGLSRVASRMQELETKFAKDLSKTHPGLPPSALATRADDSLTANPLCGCRTANVRSGVAERGRAAIAIRWLAIRGAPWAVTLLDLVENKESIVQN